MREAWLPTRLKSCGVVLLETCEHAVQKGGSEVIGEDNTDAKASSRNCLVYMCIVFFKGTYTVCRVSAVGGVDKTR